VHWLDFGSIRQHPFLSLSLSPLLGVKWTIKSPVHPFVSPFPLAERETQRSYFSIACVHSHLLCLCCSSSSSSCCCVSRWATSHQTRLHTIKSTLRLLAFCGKRGPYSYRIYFGSQDPLHPSPPLDSMWMFRPRRADDSVSVRREPAKQSV